MKLLSSVPSLVLILCLLYGCTPKPGPQTSPVVQGVQGPQAPSGALAVSPPPPPPIPTVPPPPPRAFDESLLRGQEFLLEVLRTEGPLVRDFDLGPLGLDPELTAAVEAFFLDAMDGTLDPNRLVPRWKAYLQAWARHFQTETHEGTKIRVGRAIEGSAGELTVPVKLTNPQGDGSSGWLIVVRQDGKFLVSDVQVKGTVPRTAPFDPESSD